MVLIRRPSGFKRRKDERIQETYDIFDRIEMPTGQVLPVLKYGKGKYKGNYVSGLDHKQQLLLGQLISKEVFPEGDFRYSLLPIQKSYDLIYSRFKTEQRKEFRKLNEDYLFWNREVILQEGKIFPDPIVVEEENELVYYGETIKAEINKDDVIDTLIEAGLLKQPKKRLRGRKIYFYRENIGFENGESAVSSRWVPVDGRFLADANDPSELDYEFVAFERTNEKRKTK